MLLVLAALAPLAAGVFRAVNLVGVERLGAGAMNKTRLQYLGVGATPVAGVLLIVAMLAARVLESGRIRLVAGVAVVAAALYAAVSVAVIAVTLADEDFVTRQEDAYVQVLGQHGSTALAALAAVWLGLSVLRRGR